jgi:hypothetical protein
VASLSIVRTEDAGLRGESVTLRRLTRTCLRSTAPLGRPPSMAMGLMLGIVLGVGWVALTARNGVTLGNLLIGLAIAVVVASGQDS